MDIETVDKIKKYQIKIKKLYKIINKDIKDKD